MLVNFIGVFWLAAGIMNLRWGASGERARRMSVVVGIVSIVAGVLILGRFLLIQLVGEAPIVLLLGVIIVLTGPGSRFRGIPHGDLVGSVRGRARCWARSRSCWAWWCWCGAMISARSFTRW